MNENIIKFSIPKPCHENWNEMTPDEKGRFCAVCFKSVVDFTTFDENKVQDYLMQNQNKKICGRFKNEQLTPKFVFAVPQSVLIQKRSFRKAFLLVLFVVMGTTLFSCKNQDGQTVGEIAIENDSIDKTSDVIDGEVLLGKVNNDSTNSDKFVKLEVVKEIEINEVTVGMIMPEVPDVQIDSTHKEIKSNN